MIKRLRLAALIICSGCASSFSSFNEYIPSGHDVKLSYERANEEIKILYVTCGMLIIERGSDAFMLDPFFSYQKMSDFITGIKPSKKYYAQFRQLVDRSLINKDNLKTAFISHSHYDHLMDLPVLIHDRYFPNLKSVYGNSFVPEMLFHSRKNGIEINAISDDQLYNPLTKGTDKQYSWIVVSDSIQVLPIASRHAPQKKGVLIMNSDLDADYFHKEKFHDPSARSRSSKWDAGCNYAFLVRFLKKDGNEFRLLIQTSASNPPYGLPPAGEKADLAVLCFASLQEVKDYPAYLVENSGAKKLMLIHWEDFFRHPKNIDDVKLVRATNKKLAKQRLAMVRALPEKPQITMPKPGTLITVQF
jgi:hypothetical protein